MTPRDHGWPGPPPKELCIVMLSAIGDAVHVLPVANAIRRAWPDTRITWVIQPKPHELVKGHPAIDDFVVFHRRRGLAAASGFAELRRVMRGRRFDLLLALQVYFKAGLVTALTPSEVKVGFDRARAADGQWLFTNRRIPAREPGHVQDQYFEFVEFLGIDPEPVEWRLEPTGEERAAQGAFFDGMDRPVCAAVVGTSKVEKNWHAEGWARVLDQVSERHGLQPVLVGGTSEAERRIAAEIAARVNGPVVDRLGDDLRTLTWMLEGSALAISPDTGPLHIARAVETPTVSLFGYTNPKRYGPYRAFTDLVVDGYAREPGEEYPPTRAYRDGMKRVTVDAVLQKVELAMERYLADAPESDAEA